MPNTTYKHSHVGTIEALPTPDHPFETHADWVAVKAGTEIMLGGVIDMRADVRGAPSPIMDEDESTLPYQSFDRNGNYITVTHSLRGALLAIGNRES